MGIAISYYSMPALFSSVHGITWRVWQAAQTWRRFFPSPSACLLPLPLLPPRTASQATHKRKENGNGNGSSTAGSLGPGRGYSQHSNLYIQPLSFFLPLHTHTHTFCTVLHTTVPPYHETFTGWVGMARRENTFLSQVPHILHLCRERKSAARMLSLLRPSCILPRIPFLPLYTCTACSKHCLLPLLAALVPLPPVFLFKAARGLERPSVGICVLPVSPILSMFNSSPNLPYPTLYSHPLPLILP